MFLLDLMFLGLSVTGTLTKK